MNIARQLEQLKSNTPIATIEYQAKRLAVNVNHHRGITTSNTSTYDFQDGSLIRFLTLESFDIGRTLQVQDKRA